MIRWYLPIGNFLAVGIKIMHNTQPFVDFLSLSVPPVTCDSTDALFVAQICFSQDTSLRLITCLNYLPPQAFFLPTFLVCSSYLRN